MQPLELFLTSMAFCAIFLGMYWWSKDACPNCKETVWDAVNKNTRKCMNCGHHEVKKTYGRKIIWEPYEKN